MGPDLQNVDSMMLCASLWPLWHMKAHGCWGLQCWSRASCNCT